jgi:hypothetical protein
MAERPTNMNQYERTFIFMAVALHIGLFIKVGCESQKWAQIEFIFTYFVCILLFIQFLMRYFALTHVYKTENSISSWLVSLCIVITGLVLVQSTLYPSSWFLVYGILLLLAALKTRQAIAKVMSASDFNIERVVRMKEFVIMELGFGVFMIIFYILTKVGSKIFLQLSLENTIFFGTLFAVYFTLYWTLIMILTMLRNKKVIEELMKELP